MAKTLIIAEKPSVASDIAKSLGGFKKKNNTFYESDDYVLTSAVGHLIEIKADNEVQKGKWSFANLPVIPKEFALNPIAKSKERLDTIIKLIKRKDVTQLINACDAGREGELIFRLIVQYAKAKQPIKRLWLQSMTPNAIRTGFKNLRTDKEMQSLSQAARSRAEADWLIGINGTRAMTAFNSKEGGFYLTTVGRVQTPTLSIVVKREEEIKSFVPQNYWEIKGTFKCQNGTYEGTWFDASFKKSKTNPEKKAERLWTAKQAEAIVSATKGKRGVVTEESRSASRIAPQLFDLTSLQREANARFGFSAKNTLAIAQALYEKHKVLTYPRTDSRYLPEDYFNVVNDVLTQLKGTTTFKTFANQILVKRWVKPNKRIFNQQKISDHFAIIPTTQMPAKLSEAERRIYDLVVRRFLAVFYPAAEFLVTTRTTDVNGHLFKSEGQVITAPGWLEIYGKDSALTNADAQKDKTLVAIRPNEKVLAQDVVSEALQTKPPARYSEATLLSAMEGAGKLIEEDELKEAMAGKGLGTPATRATIIEGLINEVYLIREGRELIPTAKAFQLMTLLNALNVKELMLPELTGDWEYKLAQMEKGDVSRNEFMKEIASMTKNIVKQAKGYNEETIPGDYATLKTKCPHCKGVVKENYRRYACTKCEFSISKIPGGRVLEVAEAEELLKKRQIGPLKGFRSKRGFPFESVLRIVEDEDTGNYKLEFDFGQDQEGKVTKADLKGKKAIGQCPVCKGKVYDLEMQYLCENTLDKKCTFRVSRFILQQEIVPEQVVKLLTDGKTDLLPKFISQKKRRAFKAYLVLGNKGKIDFAFQEKGTEEVPKAPAKTVAKKATTKTSAPTKVSRTTKAPAKKTVAAKKTTTTTKAPAKKTAVSKRVTAAIKRVVKKVSAKK